MKERRERRNYTEDFKKQVVNLYNNGKSRSEIIREYDLTPSAFNNWIRQYNTSGSFKAKDNRTEEEQELIELLFMSIKKHDENLVKMLLRDILPFFLYQQVIL